MSKHEGPNMEIFKERDVHELAGRILGAIEKEPLRFYDILKIFRKEEYRKVLLAWSEIMEQRRIIQDGTGRWRPTSQKKKVE